MRYINTKTKCIIDTDCKIAGGDWMLKEDTKVSKTKSKVTRTSRKKKG